MRFTAFISEVESTSAACEEVIRGIRDSRVSVDLATVFFSPHHAPEAQELIERLWLELDPQAMIGCCGEGVIGAEREVERAPGLAVLAGQMPGVGIHPFHVGKDEWETLLADRQAMAHRLGTGPLTRAVIAIGDPYSTPTGQFLQAVDEIAPGAPLVGGMASAAQLPGENLIIRNDGVYNEGLVGVSLSGPIRVDTVVSQGCRPFGRTYVITRAQQNEIQTLGGKPALACLREAVLEMPESDRELLSRGLFVGRAISEYRESFGRGDFLVRNVINVDEETGTLSIGDMVRVGQTVQFHVRDAATADEDLRLMLERQTDATPPAAGGLLFSCNGRGMRLFEQPCHDIKAAHAALPALPLAGFFAAGEFGPVGRKNFIHGHTASIALFRPGEA